MAKTQNGADDLTGARDRRKSGVHILKPVGRDAATRKYDILTALATFGLAGDKNVQRRILRLIALITARYNWQRDELAVGQVEIARLWSVDQRTVKREMAKMRAMGWLIEKRASARGRVAVHGLDLTVLLADTKSVWPNVGPDFVDRLGHRDGHTDSTPESGKVIPFHSIAAGRNDGSLWSRAIQELARLSPFTVTNWLTNAEAIDLTDGCLTISVPTRFVAQYVEANLSDQISQVLRRLDASVTRLVVTS